MILYSQSALAWHLSLDYPQGLTTRYSVQARRR